MLKTVSGCVEIGHVREMGCFSMAIKYNFGYIL